MNNQHTLDHIDINLLHLYIIPQWDSAFPDAFFRKSDHTSYQVHFRSNNISCYNTLIYMTGTEKRFGKTGQIYYVYSPKDDYLNSDFLWISDEYMSKLLQENKIHRKRLLKAEKARILLDHSINSILE